MVLFYFQLSYSAEDTKFCKEKQTWTKITKLFLLITGDTPVAGASIQLITGNILPIIRFRFARTIDLIDMSRQVICLRCSVI